MCENHKRFGNEFRINRRKSAGCTRVVYLCGLFLALVLGLAGSCVIKQVAQKKAENKQLLTQMDQRAKPYLQEANQAVPGIVRRICNPKKLAKLCWYMAVDKIRKSNKAERYLKQQLQPVTNACRKIANVYGIQADTSNTTKNVKELSLYYFFRSGSAASGLALEAVFLKSTMHALGRLLGAVVGKMSASVAAGGACAAADGPMLKAIHAQEDKEAARQKAILVAEKLRKMKLDAVAKFVEESVEETLSYMDFPSEHWRKIRTNNGFERIMKEIRRRTRVVGSFPDGYSAMMLVGARLRHVSTTKWGTRQYLACKYKEVGVL